MNDFSIVRVRALENRLTAPVSEDVRQYLASEDFLQRSHLVRQEDYRDKVRVLHYMLRTVALDPREADSMRKGLEVGLVHLRFFGVSNPAVFFALNSGDDEIAELERLKQMVEENLAGPLVRNANRVLKWRSLEKRWAFQRLENTVLKRLRAEVEPLYPSAAEHRKDPEAARKRQKELYSVMDDRVRALRDRRQRRLAILANAAAPGCPDYITMMENIALQVFTKPH